MHLVSSEPMALILKTNLILILSALLVITAGASLEAFMNTLGQNSMTAVNYAKPQTTQVNDVEEAAYDFDSQIETTNSTYFSNL
jgi:hypothetical protein